MAVHYTEYIAYQIYSNNAIWPTLALKLLFYKERKGKGLGFSYFVFAMLLNNSAYKIQDVSGNNRL
jgi:hypothetical protein